MRLETCSYVVLVRALLVNDSVEQLGQKGEDAVFFEQWLQAGKKAQTQLDVLPLSSLESCLEAIADTSNRFGGNIRLDLVAVEDDSGGEWNLERLFDAAAKS
jgi:hypothetical protein